MANSYALLTSLNGLAAGLFLMSSFGLAATRQMQGCQRFYITQSICLVVSAFLLGLGLHAPDLLAVAALDAVMKPIVIPYLLKRTVPEEIFRRREIDQVLNIPSSLLIALGLTLLAFFSERISPARSRKYRGNQSCRSGSPDCLSESTRSRCGARPSRN